MIPGNAPHGVMQPNPAAHLPLNGLGRAGVQVERDFEKAQIDLFRLVFEVGLRAGKAVEGLKATKLQLESANRGLEARIPELQTVHAAELDAAVGGHMAAIATIAGKLQGIVIKFDYYQKTSPRFTFSSEDIARFSALNDKISQYIRETSVPYPEYRDRRTAPGRPQEPADGFPLSDALILRQAGPAVGGLIEQPMSEYEELERQVAPLRACNFALTDRIAMMIDFHIKYLPEVHRQEGAPRLESILDSVRSTYDSVQWDRLARASYTFYLWGSCSPETARMYCGIDQDLLDKKVGKIKKTIEKVIKDLEALI